MFLCHLYDDVNWGERQFLKLPEKEALVCSVSNSFPHLPGYVIAGGQFYTSLLDLATNSVYSVYSLKPSGVGVHMELG